MRSGNFHRRVAALALIAAWVAPLAGAVGHSEGHGHRYCEAHRAFEEGDAAGSSFARAQRGASARGEWSAQRGSPVANAQHLQCPVAHPATRDAAVGGEVAAVSLVAPRMVEAVLAKVAPHAPLDVLSLAPKASPPRA